MTRANRLGVKYPFISVLGPLRRFGFFAVNPLMQDFLEKFVLRDSEVVAAEGRPEVWLRHLADCVEVFFVHTPPKSIRAWPVTLSLKSMEVEAGMVELGSICVLLATSQE